MEDDPGFQITIVPSGDLLGQEESRVRSSVRAGVLSALRRHHVISARIEVMLVDDPTLRALHRTHLHDDSATDVLTFDMMDPPDHVGDGIPYTDGTVSVGVVLDGAIVVSIETARREAAERGHDVAAEVALYAVHGVLHLLGYDDHEPGASARMHNLEDDILVSVGLGAVYRSTAGCGDARPREAPGSPRGHVAVSHQSSRLADPPRNDHSPAVSNASA